LNFNRSEHSNAYQQSLNAAQSAGIINPDVVVMPSIQRNYNLSVTADRRSERDELIREMGYII